jgi:flavin reductase (DIM6/NTAB) family NADH-FMN oxidoreductase RutF
MMIDQQGFRQLMAGVCAPVTVVTTIVDGVPYGATVSSLASLSLDPPLVSVAFDRASNLLARIQQAGEFGVNLLSHAQDDLARNFAVTKADKFSGAQWFTDDGLPRLADTAGWMACELNHAVEGGDHLLLFGLVRAASSRRDLPPLVYAHKTYGTHSRFAQRSRPAIADLIAACAR